MFSKIKSIFTDKNNPEAAHDNFKHPSTKDGDISQCPFMKNKNNSTESNQTHTKEQKKDKKNADSDTESEPDEKPRGGCPFMASSGAKKNPNLGITHEGNVYY